MIKISKKISKYCHEGHGDLQLPSNFSFPFLKLKLLFPSFDLDLPPRCWFKGNDDSSLLEEGQFRLQSLLQRLLPHKEIRNRCVFVI